MTWGDKNYHTWISHGLIAAALTFVFSLVLPAATAAYLAVWGYVFREGEQKWKAWRKKKLINVLDTALDAAAPIAAAALMWWWMA